MDGFFDNGREDGLDEALDDLDGDSDAGLEKSAFLLPDIAEGDPDPDPEPDPDPDAAPVLIGS